MTCGDINIWPHPTSKSQVSSHTLRFSVEDLQLRLDTPHHDVRRRLKLAFDVLVRQLRQIQRLEYASPHAEAMASASEPSAKSTDAAESPLAGGLFSSTFGSHRSGDLDSLHVKLSVHESDELNFNLDNDESYELVTSCKQCYTFYLITLSSILLNICLSLPARSGSSAFDCAHQGEDIFWRTSRTVDATAAHLVWRWGTIAAHLCQLSGQWCAQVSLSRPYAGHLSTLLFRGCN